MQRHDRVKGAVPCYPAYISPERFVDPSAAHVERLMANAPQHKRELRFRPIAGFCSNQAKKTRHLCITCERTVINELLEPAGGLERSICRLRFGRSAIELHRPTNVIHLYN